jgi:hypothetical protein
VKFINLDILHTGDLPLRSQRVPLGEGVTDSPWATKHNGYLMQMKFLLKVTHKPCQIMACEWILIFDKIEQF